MSKLLNQFVRNDGIDPSVKVDNPIQESWIHKDIVKVTGESEDDFIIEQKPVLVDSINIQKSIDEEAKTTDLKYLLKQLLLTGDESILNKKPGFYGDISKIQQVLESNGRESLDDPNLIKETLPEELHGLSLETLAKMSDEDILGYISKVREEANKQAFKVEGDPNKQAFKVEGDPNNAPGGEK